MPTVNLNKKELENSRFYKYCKQDDINMIPSDPTGSLDESNRFDFKFLKRKTYKYELLYKIRIFPSDPTGSLDDSVFIFLKKSEGSFDGRNFSFS